MTHRDATPTTPGADATPRPDATPGPEAVPLPDTAPADATPAAATSAGGAAPVDGTAPAPRDPPGTTPAHVPPDALRTALSGRLAPAARDWLDHALDEAADHPGTHGPIAAWELRLAEAGRRCGPDHADAARVLILHAARADTDALTRAYRQGTADERRAVLHALPHLVPGPGALPLIEDALRTNDTRLVAAAVGPYAARHLDAHSWRHALLKCLFTGVPVDHAAGLAARAHADTELARMLTDYAAERTAAGRTVPEDLHRVLALTESGTAAPGPAAPHAEES
ncbi:EboA domain-containing protein [Streptomyces sp. TP-A0875]|uniref:EboA domain-containing protein n=1 Tax=Streptomyces sp. TP-A0875 TaxID=552354 RepID=UPI000A9E13A7|nr:EboA domain-containing protein [Streptomyces sp. TP-A0875]